jgi:hypothetical protein
MKRHHGLLLVVASLMIGTGFTLTIYAWRRSPVVNSRDVMLRAQCRATLMALYGALESYAISHEDEWPPDLATALKYYGNADPRLQCLSSPGATGEARYFYHPPTRKRNQVLPGTIVACDARHRRLEGERGRHFLVVDSAVYVGWLSEPRFQDQLDRDINREFAEALRGCR